MCKQVIFVCVCQVFLPLAVHVVSSEACYQASHEAQLLVEVLPDLLGLLYHHVNAVKCEAVNLYRDYISTALKIPIMKKTEIPISIENWGVILVDDVLYTGRTIRSAMDALIDFGRPRFIELAVLVDRGGREFPIQPNYVSLTYKARPDENVKVCFEETDESEKVVVLKDGYSEKRKVVLS